MKPPKFVSYINDLDGSLCFCPNCHFGTFNTHQSIEYRDWYKCTHCGYMELSVTHIARIKKIVDINHGRVALENDIDKIDKEL
jgi:ribosomal protein S27AE